MIIIRGRSNGPCSKSSISGPGLGFTGSTFVPGQATTSREYGPEAIGPAVSEGIMKLSSWFLLGLALVSVLMFATGLYLLWEPGNENAKTFEEKTVDELMKDCNDPDSRVRLQAIWELSRRGK